MNIFKHSLFAIVFLISIASCKRDYTDSKVIGPANIAASDNFNCGTLATSFGASVDFTLPIPKSFVATFNETVTWKIVLTGLRSTATKTISGTSSAINSSNSLWKGNHDGIYYFETGEQVRADLIISGKSEVCSSVTFTITKAINYRAVTPTFQLVNGNRSTYNTDFEPVNSAAGIINSFPYQFNIGARTLAIKQTEAIRAPEGEYFGRIIGTSAQPNGFFVGGLQHRKSANATGTFLPVGWTDPHQLYLNIWVRGTDNLPEGSRPYATLNYECHEDDRGDVSAFGVNCNTAGADDHFCPGSEDSWVFKIPINHIGWKLFSCKYSDLIPSEDFANGGFGNRKLEPQKVVRVQLGLVSSPPFNMVSADFDFACFTYGAPLDPTK